MLVSNDEMIFQKENNMRQLDTEGKRPKKFIESRIDDLLNEVKFMRFVTFENILFQKEMGVYLPNEIETD